MFLLLLLLLLLLITTLNLIKLWLLICLTFTTLLANLADEKLVGVFLFFPENGFWLIMQIVSFGDNLHDMSKPVFCEK